jgi:hypothetical protein
LRPGPPKKAGLRIAGPFTFKDHCRFAFLLETRPCG